MHALTSVFFSKAMNATPVATKEDAERACKLLILVTEIAIQSMEKFLQKKYRDFDALVGETSCQIRAAQVQQLAAQASFVDKCAVDLETMRKMRTAFIKALPTLQAPGERVAFDRYIQQLLSAQAKDIRLQLSKEQQFLILSHALFVTRDQTVKSKTNEVNIGSFLPKEMGTLEEGICQEMVNKAKRSLADASVKYLQSVGRKESSALIGPLLRSSIRNSCELDCSPCFYTIYLLVRQILRDRLPLVIKIHREEDAFCIVLRSRDGKTFVTERITDENASAPAFVLEGVSTNDASPDVFFNALCPENDAVEEFPESRMFQVLLENAAAHPQYFGAYKEAPITLFEKIDGAVEKLAKRKLDPMKLNLDSVAKLLEEELGSFEVQRFQERIKPAPLAEAVLANLQMKALRQRAFEEGCSATNSALFSIKHIFVSTLRDTLGTEETPKAESKEEEKEMAEAI